MLAPMLAEIGFIRPVSGTVLNKGSFWQPGQKLKVWISGLRMKNPRPAIRPAVSAEPVMKRRPFQPLPFSMPVIAEDVASIPPSAEATSMVVLMFFLECFHLSNRLFMEPQI